MTRVSSLYLHVPFCLHLCNYCDFYKRNFDNPSDQFESFHLFLERSFEIHRRFLESYDIQMEGLETVYLGGGTPSLWGVEGANFFAQHFKEILPDAEFTMEIDPGTWTENMITAWKKIGMNRVSIGTQTLDSKFLKIMDRKHSLEQSLELLSKMQQERCNFSLDFLLGIPYSKEFKRNLKKELDTFLSFSPPHVSLYILNARSKYPLIQKIPDDDYIRDEYLFVSDYLQSKGFHQYEVSNFALPGYESKHNKKYWGGESVAALGPTGTGFVRLSPNHALRYKWKVSRPEMELEKLGLAELDLESTYLGLRTSEGWRPARVSFELRNLFTSWEKNGYGLWSDQKMTLLPQGFVVLDSLMEDLFRLRT